MDAIASQFGPVARQLFDAWSQLPRRDGVPERASFDPMVVARILPVVSLLQRCGTGEWRFRLVGTEIERRWAMRLTGLNIVEIIAPVLAAPLQQELQEVIARPCGSWSKRRVEFESGRFGTIEALRLPLRTGPGEICLILSCSGELPVGGVVDKDRRHAVVKLIEQRFFDIGCGLGRDSVLPAAPPAEAGVVGVADTAPGSLYQPRHGSAAAGDRADRRAS